MWRLCKLGYRHEPRLMIVSFVLSQLAALPDALLALWLWLLGKGVLQHQTAWIEIAAVGLGVSTAATWFLRTISTRVQRRFRDKVTIALEAHVARLQATVITVAHHERPEYLDRLSMLRNQVFVLDHMYVSLFSTLGWILRLGVTLALLASIHPALLLLAVFAIPTVLTSGWRPAVERAAQERGAQSSRLSRHLFTMATTAAPGKEVRVTGIGERLITDRRAAWERWYGPVAAARWGSALWHALGWAIFGAGVCGRGGLRVVRICARPPARCCWCWPRVRGYRGTSAPPWARSGSCAASGWMARGAWRGWRTTPPRWPQRAICRCPRNCIKGCASTRFLCLPGHAKVVLEDVSLFLPAGAVVAIVGENGAGKTTLVKLVAKMYEPTSGAILVDDVPLSRLAAGEWRRAWRAHSRISSALSFAPGTRLGLGDVPRMDDGRRWPRPSTAPGAGDVVDRLEIGLDTQLGPTWPDGVELSFGQWQKLALARGFMRDQPLLLILDEPTAALDAETEHALFERYAAAARAATAAAGSRCWCRTASLPCAWPT